MVWVHGGGYFSGSGMMYDAEALAIKGNVIVVTINYRLNMFGFATLGDDGLKGNYGLWDQKMALKWVHENIHSFGGDPNSVTIFGESAGGFSVALQAIIPSNKGLFQRVIAQSGTANTVLATSTVGANTTKEIGSYLGCNDSAPTVFLSCLRSKSASSILNATYTFVEKSPVGMNILNWLGPVVDNELLPEWPSKLLRNKSSDATKFFKSLDVIFGNTDAEGSLLFSAITDKMQRNFHFNFTRGMPHSTFCAKFVPTIVKDFFKHDSQVSRAICSEYGVQQNITEQARQAVNMYTDLFFISPTLSSLLYHAESNTLTKQYQYVMVTDHSPGPFLAGPQWFRGAQHGTDIIYLFLTQTLLKLNMSVTPAELALQDTMINYWANFAKHG